MEDPRTAQSIYMSIKLKRMLQSQPSWDCSLQMNKLVQNKWKLIPAFTLARIKTLFLQSLSKYRVFMSLGINNC